MPTINPMPGMQITPDGRITTDRFLKTPTQISRLIERLSDERFVADYLFTGSGAQGGAVVYDRNVEPSGNLYIDGQDGRDVEAIAPGSEFPRVSPGEGVPETAIVQKYGGEIPFSREVIRRDQRDVLARGMRMLSNTVVRKTNRIAVNTVVSDPGLHQLTLSTKWTETGADPIYDLMSALSLVNENDFGYLATTVLLNKADSLALLGRKDVREQLPRENAQLNPVLNPQLGRLMGVEWITSDFVPKGTLYVVDRNTIGGLGDEEGGIQTDRYDQPGTHSVVIQAWRTVVPYITDPKAGVRVTGVS